MGIKEDGQTAQHQQDDEAAAAIHQHTQKSGDSTLPALCRICSY